LAQKRKSSPTVHHPFDELNPGDLRFHLAVVVRERQSSQDSGFVPFKPLGKAVQFWDVAGSH
jgi:hypothetical protein